MTKDTWNNLCFDSPTLPKWRFVMKESGVQLLFMSQNEKFHHDSGLSLLDIAKCLSLSTVGFKERQSFKSSA